LLTQIYLETQRSLVLQNQGGARVKVQDIELEDLNVTSSDVDSGFQSECTWQVSGSVGHWGHTHIRRNRYQAKLTVQPVEGVWKVTALELLSEKRI